MVPSWPNIASRDYRFRLPPHGSVQIDIAAGRNNSYALPIDICRSFENRCCCLPTVVRTITPRKNPGAIFVSNPAVRDVAA
jgi:hypothetical protein